MQYPPVQPAHLHQIRELNEVFVELVTRETPEYRFPGLTPAARRLLSGCDPRQRAVLAALPRALFQLELSPQQQQLSRPASEDAVRCFAITALSVACHMVRDSRFAARVLFAGSGPALSLLACSHVGQLLDYSAQPGLITCPLLAAENRVSPLLMQQQRQSARASSPSRIALGHALCILPVAADRQQVLRPALSSAN